MGNVNIGGQKILFNFKNLISSSDFNSLLSGLYPTGVYDGLTFTLGSGIVIGTKGNLIIRSKGSDGKLVKVEITENNYTIGGFSETNNILVARWEYKTEENNYLDFLFVSSGNKLENDIELCRITYSGGNPTGIDYSYRDRGFVNLRGSNYLDVYSKSEVYTKSEGDGRYLQRSNNLSDLNNVATARTNLNVYSKSEGDGRYLQRSNNLNDLNNVATARTNLDVYSKSEGDGRYLRLIGGTVNGNINCDNILKKDSAGNYRDIPIVLYYTGVTGTSIGSFTVATLPSGWNSSNCIAIMSTNSDGLYLYRHIASETEFNAFIDDNVLKYYIGASKYYSDTFLIIVIRRN